MAIASFATQATADVACQLAQQVDVILAVVAQVLLMMVVVAPAVGMLQLNTTTALALAWKPFRLPQFHRQPKVALFLQGQVRKLDQRFSQWLIQLPLFFATKGSRPWYLAG